MWTTNISTFLFEYAKADYEDICIKITAHNRADEVAPLHILPTIWFRNCWSWDESVEKPNLQEVENSVENLSIIELKEQFRGEWNLVCEGSSQLLFTENETNLKKLYNAPNASIYAKDGINDFVVEGNKSAVNPNQTGTKAAAHYVLMIAPKSSETIYLRLTRQNPQSPIPNPQSLDEFITDCESIFALRIAEADEFYADIIPEKLSDDAKSVMRQACAGMLWSKQFYHFVVKEWLDGDPAQPKPPEIRQKGRNSTWKHLYNDDVISMPDKWEYPWYAAWDLAFHCISLALVDADFAKNTANFDAPRMVYAPERTNSRL